MELRVKDPVKVFLALPIAFQAPGHLIPGPKNLIQEKGDKNQEASYT